MVLMNLFSTLTLCVLLRLPHHRPTSFASGGSGWIAHISRLYEKEMHKRRRNISIPWGLWPWNFFCQPRNEILVAEHHGCDLCRFSSEARSISNLDRISPSRGRKAIADAMDITTYTQTAVRPMGTQSKHRGGELSSMTHHRFIHCKSASAGAKESTTGMT